MSTSHPSPRNAIHEPLRPELQRRPCRLIATEPSEQEVYLGALGHRVSVDLRVALHAVRENEVCRRVQAKVAVVELRFGFHLLVHFGFGSWLTITCRTQNFSQTQMILASSCQQERSQNSVVPTPNRVRHQKSNEQKRATRTPGLRLRRRNVATCKQSGPTATLLEPRASRTRTPTSGNGSELDSDNTFLKRTIFSFFNRHIGHGKSKELESPRKAASESARPPAHPAK
jgi:hypothetical protein